MNFPGSYSSGPVATPPPWSSATPTPTYCGSLPLACIGRKPSSNRSLHSLPHTARRMEAIHLVKQPTANSQQPHLLSHRRWC